MIHIDCFNFSPVLNLLEIDLFPNNFFCRIIPGFDFN